MQASTTPPSRYVTIANDSLGILATRDSPRSGHITDGIYKTSAFTPAESQSNQTSKSPQSADLAKTRPLGRFSDETAARNMESGNPRSKPNEEKETERRCNRCGHDRPLAEFARADSNSQLAVQCIRCRTNSEAAKDWFKTPDERNAARRNKSSSKLKLKVDRKLEKWKEQCKSLHLDVSLEHFNEINSYLLKPENYSCLKDNSIPSSNGQPAEPQRKRKRTSDSSDLEWAVDGEDASSNGYDTNSAKGDDTSEEEEDGDDNEAHAESHKLREARKPKDIFDKSKDLFFNRVREMMVNEPRSTDDEAQPRQSSHLEKAINKLIANSKRTRKVMRKFHDEFETPEKKDLEKKRDCLMCDVSRHLQQDDDAEAEFNRAKTKLENEAKRLNKEVARVNKELKELEKDFADSKAKRDTETEKKKEEIAKLNREISVTAKELKAAINEQGDCEKEVKQALASTEATPY